MHFFTYIIITLLTVPACVQKKTTAESAKWRREVVLTNHKSQSQQIAKSKNPPVTIWVHGTTSNPLFQYFHAGPRGLHRMSDLGPLYNIRNAGKVLEQQDAYGFSYGHCYLFSWSGKLSFEAREQAARELYKELRTLVAAYKELCKCPPSIRIIAHSHGGNVVLNMAKLHDTQNNFCVDELTLLGCPVQHVTSPYCADPFFKAVNNIVSDVDILQVGDPQGLYAKTKEVEKDPSFFSERWFAPCPRLVQVRLKINGRAPFHSEMIFQPFIKTIPAIIAECKTIRAEQVAGAAPDSAHYLFKITR
jgi:hypothetical protein